MRKQLEIFGRWYSCAAALVFNTLLVVLLVELLLGLVIDVRQVSQEKATQTIDERAHLPAYEGYAWSEDLWREYAVFNSHWSRFEPYTHWLTRAFTGKYINVDEGGRRKTLDIAAANAKKVYFFGGSTAFCAQSPDDMTIASYLQRLLGPGYRVVNMGQGGFVSTQEVNLLLKLLAEDERPDYVIFFDGVNDIFAGMYSPAIPRDPHNVRFLHEQQMRKEEAERASSSLLSRFAGFYRGSNLARLVAWVNFKRQPQGAGFVNGNGVAQWEQGIEGKIESNAAATMHTYEANMQAVQALGAKYGFQSFFFWQPSLLTLKRPLAPYEETILKEVTPVYRKGHDAADLIARQTLANRQREHIFYIADTFDDKPPMVYVDFCHVSPRGNEIIAERIFSCLNQPNQMTAKAAKSSLNRVSRK